MRKICMLVLLALVALPAFSATRVSVDQLEHLLASQHGKPDSKLAARLFSLELTERLSAEKLAHLEAGTPGPESRRALMVLADFSAFLDPPAAEIPQSAAPDAATQRNIVTKAVDYVVHAMHEFPNFMATRDTIHFEDSPARQTESNLGNDGQFIPYAPLHPVSRSSARVVYRDGKEIADAVQAAAAQTGAPGLNTSGEFGAILGMVLVDAAHGTVSWSHWEQGARGQVAVFHYAVPREKSDYEVTFCCIATEKSANYTFRKYTGYRGEIAISPADGAILRVSLMADLTKDDPVVKSDILVEYGPVLIGAKEYICPLRSISISRSPAAQILHTVDRGLEDVTMQQSDAPLQTMLNETAFEQYHVFGSEIRLLTGENAAPSSAPAASGTEAHAVEQEQRAPGDGSQGAAAAASTETAETAAPAASDSAGASAAAPAASEIATAKVTALPEAPAAAVTNFTLHVTTRLVDVELLALDKKGRPVEDLRLDDFELDDNGRKQAVRSFHAPGGVAPSAAAASTAADDSSAQVLFSNRRQDAIGESAGAETARDRAAILLIDSTNLTWQEFQHVREQASKFLRALPAGARVGLYAMNARGFQILVEATTDHASAAAALQAWMASARDFAHAQNEDQSNRPPFDFVSDFSDLAQANGSAAATSLMTQTSVDPNPRGFGSHPGRDALQVLTAMARHLAAIAGHKDLMWLASESVLADWSGAAAGNGENAMTLSDPALSVQEALNDAQVSLYPLDASQMEMMTADEGIRNPSVQPGSGAANANPMPDQQSGNNSTESIAPQMQHDMRPVQTVIRQVAAGTGGQAFGRSGDIVAELNQVLSAGHGAYSLGFSPDTPADDRYHALTVKLTARRGVTLRYRSGYFYAKEPPTLKERFRQAIWQPLDAGDIAVTARPAHASDGTALYLHITTTDLGLALENGVWADKLDIFLVQRDDAGLRARVSGKTLVLRLKPDTYQRILKEDVPFDQFVAQDATASSVRMIVVDENTGRMGSVTLPAAALQAVE